MRRRKDCTAQLVELTNKINRYFGIRIEREGRSSLVGLPHLSAILDDDERTCHIANKALRSRSQNPTFRAKGITIVFFSR